MTVLPMMSMTPLTTNDLDVRGVHERLDDLDDRGFLSVHDGPQDYL